MHNIKTNAQMEQTAVPMFYCPSRRPPTKEPTAGRYLMDYAAAVPSRPSSQRTPAPNWNQADNAWGVLGCRFSGDGEFWGSRGGTPRFESEFGSVNWTASGSYTGYNGVIVRSDYCGTCTPKRNVGFYSKIGFEQITDGSSNTMVIGEKRLQPSLYEIGDWHDDKGWSDGWDPDTLRCTFCPPGPDKDMPSGAAQASALPYSFGGAHTEMFNAGFADASVRSVRFDVDVELLNRLGHRSDDEQMDMGAF